MFRILVIDDQPEEKEISKISDHFGSRVEVTVGRSFNSKVASDRGEPLGIHLISGPFDLLILDFQLLGDSGGGTHQMLECIHERSKIPVIGYSEFWLRSAIRKYAKRLGMNVAVGNIGDLLEALEQIVP